jgi:hypothetical protein
MNFGSFGDFGDELALDPEKYINHIVEHFEAGEMTLREALEAAQLLTNGRAIDITREWQCVLIAFDEEDLAQHFNHVALCASKQGIGITLGMDRSDPLWEPSEVTAEQKLIMDRATMACLRRAGIEAHFHDDGKLHIPRPENPEEDIISKFIDELNELPEQDPDRKGWGKWTT